MASYGETLYAAMLRAQMEQATQGWMQAEREREIKMDRDDQAFDQTARVFEMLQQAQAAEHQRKLDTAKMMGMAGKELPADIEGPAYTQTAEAAGESYRAQEAAKALADKRAQKKYFGGIEKQSALSLRNQQTMAALKDQLREAEARKDHARRMELQRLINQGKVAGAGGSASARAVAFDPVRRGKEAAQSIYKHGQDIQQTEFDVPSRENAAAMKAQELGRMAAQKMRMASTDVEKMAVERWFEDELQKLQSQLGLTFNFDQSGNVTQVNVQQAENPFTTSTRDAVREAFERKKKAQGR